MEKKEPIYLVKKGKSSILHLIFSRVGVASLFLVVQICFMLLFFLYVSTNYVHVFYGGTIIVNVFGYVYLLNTRTDTNVKIMWMALFTILPIVGIFIYFYFQLELGFRLEKRRLIHVRNQSNHLLHTKQEIVNEVIQHKELHGIAHYINRIVTLPVYKNTKLMYYSSGEAKFKELIQALEQAQEFIFLEYFIVAEGKMWGTILDILITKAAQGVEIRFLYDGFNEFSNLPHNYPKRLEKLGIQCKIFAPIRPFVSSTHNFRDHRKIVVIDGKIAFTGGINLSDEYINEVERFGFWKDTAIKVQGEAVNTFTLLFLQMWAMEDGVPEFERWLNRPQELFEEKGFVLPYGDAPLEDDRIGEFVYLEILNKATDYVHIMSPYLILDDEMRAALVLAAKRGIDVKIILPHIPDKKYAFALAKSHYRELIEAGVLIFEFSPGFMHAKVFVSDDVRGTVGTVNLDYRSFYHHFECGVYMEQVEVLSDIEKDFQDTLAVSKQITFLDCVQEKMTTRIAGWVLKLIAPLM